MGIKQVRALERDDYAALPKGTFLRGFVRNFAKEVGIAPDEALRVLGETHREAAATNASAVVMPSQQNISVPTPGGTLATPRARALIALLIACLLLGVFWYWWEYVRPHRAEGGRPKPVVEDKAVSEPIVLPAPAVSTVPAEAAGTTPSVPPFLPQGSQPVEQSVAASTASAPTPTAAPFIAPITPPEQSEVAPVVPRPVLPPGSGLLGFTFSGESWVEVTDRNGKIVLDRKFKDGEAQEVVGRPPFSVVVGNAKATRMAYNGKEIDLAPHTRVAVARLTVN